MAQPAQFATDLVNETVQTFNGDVTTVSPTDGISLIDNWVSALDSGNSPTSPVADTLHALKGQLQQGSLNGTAIQALVQELADQTHQAAQQVEGGEQQTLLELAAALRGFGQQLLGNSPQDDQSRQGDMDDPTGSNGGQASLGMSNMGGTGTSSTDTTVASHTDNSDMRTTPTTGSPSIGGDRYGQ